MNECKRYTRMSPAKKMRLYKVSGRMFAAAFEAAASLKHNCPECTPEEKCWRHETPAEKTARIVRYARRLAEQEAQK